MAYILVFGDSAVYGAWDFEGGGWVQRLRRFAEKRIDRESGEINVVYNCGISGQTTRDLLKHFEAELKARVLDATKSKIATVISLGVNDSSYVQSEKANWVPKEEFAKNLKNLFKISRKYTNSIFFISLQPIDDSKTNPFTGDKDLFYTNKNIKEYDEIAKSVCKQEKIELIDIYDTLKDSKRLTAEDGLHLNSKGHKLIFETVKDLLIKKKII